MSISGYFEDIAIASVGQPYSYSRDYRHAKKYDFLHKRFQHAIADAAYREPRDKKERRLAAHVENAERQLGVLSTTLDERIVEIRSSVQAKIDVVRGV